MISVKKETLDWRNDSEAMLMYLSALRSHMNTKLTVSMPNRGFRSLICIVHSHNASSSVKFSSKWYSISSNQRPKNTPRSLLQTDPKKNQDSVLKRNGSGST